MHDMGSGQPVLLDGGIYVFFVVFILFSSVLSVAVNVCAGSDERVRVGVEP